MAGYWSLAFLPVKDFRVWLLVLTCLAGCGPAKPPPSGTNATVPTIPVPPATFDPLPLPVGPQPGCGFGAGQPYASPFPGGFSQTTPVAQTYTGPLLTAELKRFVGHQGAVTAVGIRTNDIYSGGADGTLRRWDTVAEQASGRWDASELANYGRIALCRNAPLLATAGYDGSELRLRIRDMSDGSVRSIPIVAPRGEPTPPAPSGFGGASGGLSSSASGFGLGPAPVPALMNKRHRQIRFKSGIPRTKPLRLGSRSSTSCGSASLRHAMR